MGKRALSLRKSDSIRRFTNQSLGRDTAGDVQERGPDEYRQLSRMHEIREVEGHRQSAKQVLKRFRVEPSSTTP